MSNKKDSTKYYHSRIFGCQMNKSDGERISAVMEGAGYSPTLDEEKADVIIAVACSVRQSAVDRIYGLSGRWEKLKRRNPRLKRILAGCVLEYDRRKLAGRFDAVIPITKIGEIPKLVTSHSSLVTRDDANDEKIRNKKLETRNRKSIINYQLSIIDDGKTICDYLSIPPKRQSKHQTYVPIMTGCDNFCSYCVVPYVRGREKSRPVEEVADEVRGLIERGYKEITLLGENVNRYKSRKAVSHKAIEPYGRKAINSPSSRALKLYGSKALTDFPTLLKILTKIPGKFWLRFVTSHPEDFTDELIGVIASEPKICKYIHLPLQSGSSAVLKKMNRKYTKDEYARLVKKIRKAMPDVALSTDIIVGFPSETKEQFEETAEVMRKLRFDMAYIAQYSPRLGTQAARLEDDVAREEKKRRERVLTGILEETASGNNRRLIGKTLEVLVESRKAVSRRAVKLYGSKILGLYSSRALWLGKTEGFKKVRFEGPSDLVGKFVKVKILGAGAWGLRGKLIR